MSRRFARRREATAGRTPRTVRRGILLACYLTAGVAVVAKSVKLQVVEHDRWIAAAEDQHRERVELPARRGGIFDRKGVPLAVSHEMFAVSVAPRELRDPRAVAGVLRAGLGLSAGGAAAAIDPTRRWVVLPGRYTAEQRRAVGTVRGVYFSRQFERFYPQGDAGREIIGAVTRDGRSLGGIEQQFDEVLRGEAGYSVLRRDARGAAEPTISLPVVPPTEGASIHLTIDFDLQEIADAALREAMRTTGSSGGDLLLSDPHTGEVLAAVSRRGGTTRSLTAITEPYEPGSTLKPFLVATLLAERSAALDERIFAEQGTWRDGGRTIRDTSPHGWLTLREALEVSSNIAFVKFAQRLSWGQQFSYLRDFGLGTLTGIEYPAESSGWLRRPAEWSRMSPASLAMGYELSVTPLQMLAAYGALANGGVLMEPYLVGEIRGPDGRVLAHRTPQAIRRVVPAEVARAVTSVLVNVVEEGTATRASLSTFSVAGKTGTSRRTTGSGGYAAGSYTSTFVGYFPAQDAQIVIFVKLDEPKGAYYGGLTAAPVTRETLQGILAARTRAIDGRTLLASRSAARSVSFAAAGVGSTGVAAMATAAAGTLPAMETAPSAPGRQPARPAPVRLTLRPDGEPPVDEESPEPARVVVPDLRGLPLREAARRGHEAGLQIRISGTGEVRGSQPAAGVPVAHGSTITLSGSGM